jgi:hypothetical protein
VDHREDHLLDIDPSKIRADQPGCAGCLIFASGDMWLIDWHDEVGCLEGVGKPTAQYTWRSEVNLTSLPSERPAPCRRLGDLVLATCIPDDKSHLILV